MKKLVIVLLALMLAGCVSTKKYKQLDRVTLSHIQLRNQIISELVNAKTEEEKQKVIKKYGIKITQPDLDDRG
ncbi:hypothetical protein LCGC14_0399150 [marine sediment metagenome]|uniref:Lipoprotein n=1 Tax=marine sediment metagenome TaxID=412755 RepID=A0A0F9T318_9ZZZZ|nr:hypothetical protein [Candidatus Aminicenantes bacterium]